MAADTGRCVVIEKDTLTGWRSFKSGALPEAEAEEAIARWRKVTSGRYSFEAVPVVTWMLDITTGDQHTLFIMALDSKLAESVLVSHDPPTVRIRDNGNPGGQVWAYTRKGTTSPPAWLTSLCGLYEDAGFEAGIRRP